MGFAGSIQYKRCQPIWVVLEAQVPFKCPSSALQMPIKCPSSALPVPFWFDSGSILVRCWFYSDPILILFLFALSAAGDRRNGKAGAKKTRRK